MTYVSPLHKQVPLELNKKYYLVADEFITTGGDGYSPQFFPTQQEVKVEGMPSTTDAFVQYLKSCPCIPTPPNSVSHTNCNIIPCLSSDYPPLPLKVTLTWQNY